MFVIEEWDLVFFIEFCPLLLGFLLPFDPKWTSAFCDMAFILSSSFIEVKISMIFQILCNNENDTFIQIFILEKLGVVSLIYQRLETESISPFAMDRIVIILYLTTCPSTSLNS